MLAELQSKIKDCRTVLSELGFRETRLNYWVREGIHVETRTVCDHECFEIIDYRHRTGPTKIPTHLTGTGAYDLKHRLVVMQAEVLPRIGRP